MCSLLYECENSTLSTEIKRIVYFYRNMFLRGLHVLCSIKQGKIFHYIKYKKLKQITVL